ncbi:mitochondrial 18 KDa protein-domain-containing protein [Mycena rebaudengoi]|nr:mitochondrial 18 KDa protein-domain-containing protein [Mycena rebaudengoi]
MLTGTVSIGFVFSSRYVAYTSDVDEAFRPVVPPWAVSAAYGVSWLHLGGDVAYAFKAHRQGPTPTEAAYFSEPARISLAAVPRATFQSIASMTLPAFTIHTAVRQAEKAFDKSSNLRLKTRGPTGRGLTIVPLLPYLFDHPLEHVTDRVFDWIREKLAEQDQGRPIDL